MWSIVLSVLLIAYLPGTLIFRLPFARRRLRAELPAEERFFWGIVISLLVSSIAGLALAAGGWYHLDRLLWINGGLGVSCVIVSLGRLRLEVTAPRPTWTAFTPIALAIFALAVFFHVPTAEYVMGGKDPGTYMNEGIQIAQRGSLVVTDRTVASLPPRFRDLFVPEFDDPTYYSSRFMGFFLLDPDDGRVVGQFPHLYPVWIAIGYGINGLSGARQVIGLWAVLGVVAVYFAGAWLVGRPAAAAGAFLLSVHVAQVWYSRYPNAELLVQAFLFAAVLAFSRANAQRDPFLAPLAALLVTVSLFAHFTTVLAVAALAGASLLGVIDGRRPQASFLSVLAIGTAIAAFYYSTILEPYFARPIQYFGSFGATHIALAVFGLVMTFGLLWSARRQRSAAFVRRWLPWVLLGVLWVLAAYAYLLRMPAGRLAPHDAEALRLFTQFYLSPLGLAVALGGLAIVVRRSFWSGLAFVLMVTAFSCFTFYKIRIIPEHFWTARRFIPVILPAAFLLIGAVAFFPASLTLRSTARRGARPILFALGVAVVLFFGNHYFSATRPILDHVEYAGLIPRVEALASLFDETDLVLVESREASDTHTLALPLAYIYARNVLVFYRADPDKMLLREFLVWVRGRYARTLFVGGSGSRLLSRSVLAEPLTLERFQIPEYESAYRDYPREVRYKEFHFGVYELLPRLESSDRFELDVGTMDDLFVRRFHDKEIHGSSNTTFRWTRARSSITIPDASVDATTLTLWLNDGGRPATLPPVRLTVSINGVALGTVTATSEFEPFEFEIPVWLATQIATGEDASDLQLESGTWNPGDVLGGNDDRDVGVMVDRVTFEE